jgi:cell fate (sporulation/competence/biofilm development) regulator YlbF (YheA/YmcA/DUF963 family)
MLDILFEKARDLGRLLGQTNEYQALQRAREQLANDREANRVLNRLGELEEDVARALEQGQAPPEAVREEYERLTAELQTSPVYQAFIVAQSNFDKVLVRMNDEISKGMEAGAQSRIILPS